MSQTLKQIEKVENLINNCLGNGIYTPTHLCSFERVSDNKTIFRTKYSMELVAQKEIEKAFQTMIEMVPNVTIYPLSNREIEIRVY